MLLAFQRLPPGFAHLLVLIHESGNLVGLLPFAIHVYDMGSPGVIARQLTPRSHSSSDLHKSPPQLVDHHAFRVLRS